MAGRTKAGVEPGLAEDLARFLRQLRRRPDGTDLTYIELADRLDGARYCSAATLSRADRGGDCIPRLETVRGYVKACGGWAHDQEQARRLLAAAHRRRRRAKTASTYADPRLGARAARRQHPAVAPHPHYIRTPVDFQLGLRSYREENGSLSLRAIALNASRSGYPISKSAVDRMLSQPRSFPTWDQVMAVLVGCRPKRMPDLNVWHRAWRHAFVRPKSPAAAAVWAKNEAILSVLMEDRVLLGLLASLSDAQGAPTVLSERVWRAVSAERSWPHAPRVPAVAYG
ncbi:hypothetical protein Kpho02_72620 [Kitasatospora phosalacinea]|uniref:Uncharacterized protein n=1 Tax=Kitasatospora phosalacinea TaxID=2065 RepID=A0A9W6QEI3_9ACTN|nr:helix-turn-helix transcriptional regulator [Kitasatospora phosalacinea]GLW74965.1 hypothetical protein Kpho02_72620 [Kitasatospora phosalacinea]